MSEEIDVVQGVAVLGVTEDGEDLHVDVFGGDRNVCGTIRFTFPDHSERAAMKRQLERWRRHATPVTFVSTDTSISLQDDRALFGDDREQRAAS